MSCGCTGAAGGGGTGAAGGSGRSSGGEKPRLGNAGTSPVRVAARSLKLGEAEAVLVVSPDQSVAGAGVWVRANWLPSCRLLVVLLAAICPM